MDPELIAYLDRRFDAVDAQIDGLRQETNQRFERLEGRFDKVEDTLHLMGVRIEDIESKVQLLAEGQQGIRETMARDKAELQREIEDVRRDLNLFARHVNERFDAVDDRFEKIEALEARVIRLEHRLAS